MHKIIIKVPKDKKDKWKMGWGHSPKSSARADTLLNRLNKVLASRLRVEGKTAIMVKEYTDNHWENVNESLDSSDRDYLVYCTSCFLEDYLSKKVIRSYGKKTGYKSVPDDEK